MVGNALLTFTYITHCIDSLQESFYLREREDADIPKKKKKLTKLHLTRAIISCPVLQIGNCKNVTVMSLRSNKLEFLPDEIGQMTKLRVLNLSDNR